MNSSHTPTMTLASQPTSEEDDGGNSVPYEYYGRNGELQMAANYIEKLQTLRYLLETDLLACDAKWTLFVAAALSYRYDTQLKPFPPRFVSEQMGLNIDALVSVINDTPSLRVVLQNITDENFEDIDAEVLDLLHHVLVVARDPMLRLVDDEEAEELLRIMEESQFEVHPTHVFEVCSAAEFSEEISREERLIKINPVKFAFYGNKLDAFFSVLSQSAYNAANQGQDVNRDNTEKRSMLLSTDLATSLDRSPIGAGWGASACGSMISCVALCEFNKDLNCMDDEDFEYKLHEKELSADIEVRNSDLVQVRYLFFYGSRFPDDEVPRKRNMLGWLGRHKYSLSLCCYMLMLASIGVANSGSGQYWRHLISKKMVLILDFCKRMFTNTD